MTRPSLRGLVLVAIAAVFAVGVSVAVAGSGVQRIEPLSAAPSAETGRLTNESPKLWLVEFPSAPLAEGSAQTAVDGDNTSFRAEAKSEGVNYKERFRFRSLWNGVSIEAKADAIQKIEKFGSVKAVFPVGLHAIPPSTPVSAELATAIQMTGADVAQNELGLTGRGVRVAVMDTGIDLQHPALGAGFGPGSRIATGYDFVGDAYDGSNTPAPDAIPDDCNGHGTHVAGIIGANGRVTGVAPGVTFGAYKVFGCTGDTTDDVLIAAMERVLRDHMDVLNISIGAAFDNWPDAPLADAADRLVKKGVVVVASAGNSGANGLYSTGEPAVGSRVIGVGSFENVQLNGTPYFKVSSDNTRIGYLLAEGAPNPPTAGTAQLTRTGTATSSADACTSLTAASLTGKVVLVRRGGCTFYTKAQNAQLAGATAVVLYNNVAGWISPDVSGAPPVTIPVVSVSDEEGLLLDGRIAAHATTITWTANRASFPNVLGNRISSFSSYGLAADLSLKPDISAPGGFIFSTLPLEQGGYGTLSGTSMAAPHVSGAVALLLQSRRGRNQDDGDNNDDNKNLTRAGVVRDILQNSADPKPWWGDPSLGFLDNVHRQGAGMLRIDNAILAKTLVRPGKLSLGENESGGPITERITITNSAASSVTYDLSDEAALSTGPNTFTPSFLTGFATVTFRPSSITVPSGGSRSVEVSVTPDPDLPDQSVYGGYVVLTPSAGGSTLRVPYAGFKGDYQSIQILTPVFGLPWLTDADLSGPLTGGTFSMAGADQPNIAFHLHHQARRLTLFVVDARGHTRGRAIELEYLPRNSTSTGVFVLPWDGTYMPGEGGKRVKTAPDGRYTLVLKVEKPLADRNNPAHFETWTSPAFTIDRP